MKMKLNEIKYDICDIDYMILRAPQNRHLTTQQVKKFQRRGKQFCTSKAHLKARYKKALTRFFRRIVKLYAN